MAGMVLFFFSSKTCFPSNTMSFQCLTHAASKRHTPSQHRNHSGCHVLLAPRNLTGIKQRRCPPLASSHLPPEITQTLSQASSVNQANGHVLLLNVCFIEVAAKYNVDSDMIQILRDSFKRAFTSPTERETNFVLYFVGV